MLIKHRDLAKDLIETMKIIIAKHKECEIVMDAEIYIKNNRISKKLKFNGIVKNKIVG